MSTEELINTLKTAAASQNISMRMLLIMAAERLEELANL